MQEVDTRRVSQVIIGPPTRDVSASKPILCNHSCSEFFHWRERKYHSNVRACVRAYVCVCVCVRVCDTQISQTCCNFMELNCMLILLPLYSDRLVKLNNKILRTVYCSTNHVVALLMKFT